MGGVSLSAYSEGQSRRDGEGGGAGHNARETARDGEGDMLPACSACSHLFRFSARSEQPLRAHVFATSPALPTRPSCADWFPTRPACTHL
jgi:hypothetical protein